MHRLIVKYDLHDEFLHDFDRLPENRIYKPVKVQGPPPPKTAEGEIVQTADVLTKDLPGIGTWIEDEVRQAERPCVFAAAAAAVN